MMCAVRRVVVVLPLVPVMAMMGMRLGVPGGKSMSTTGSATLRPMPSVGSRCMRKPGAAFTSSTAPPVSVSGCVMSSVMMSMPQMSRSMMREMRSAMKTL